MPSISDNKIHQANVWALESARQSDVSAAIALDAPDAWTAAMTARAAADPRYSPLLGSQDVAAASKAAEVKFYRACLTSALATGANPAPFLTALKELGSGPA